MAAAELSLLGLGPMGAPMAGRLLDAGWDLTVWNRTAAKTHPFVDRGGRAAATPAEAARPIVLTVLPDLPQVVEVLGGPDGLRAGWRARGIERPILVVHGTTSPADTRDLAERMLRDDGVVLIDAPVSGGTVGAAAGTLSVMVGGDAAVVDALRPVFGAYARLVTRFGDAGSGAVAKACNQIVVASTVAAISEALVLADGAGLDRRDLLDVLGAGLADSEVLRQKREKWISDDFRPGGSARNQAKDLHFVADAARSWGVDLPTADAVRTLFDRTLERGDGDLDHTGVIRTVAARKDPS